MEDKNDMRAYVKPELFYENFELAQNIAACQWDYDNTLTNPELCYAVSDDWSDMDVRVFNNSLCNTGNESYCYEPGNGGQGLFNS